MAEHVLIRVAGIPLKPINLGEERVQVKHDSSSMMYIYTPQGARGEASQLVT